MKNKLILSIITSLVLSSNYVFASYNTEIENNQETVYNNKETFSSFFNQNKLQFRFRKRCMSHGEHNCMTGDVNININEQTKVKNEKNNNKIQGDIITINNGVIKTQISGKEFTIEVKQNINEPVIYKLIDHTNSKNPPIFILNENKNNNSNVIGISDGFIIDKAGTYKITGIIKGISKDASFEPSLLEGFSEAKKRVENFVNTDNYLISIYSAFKGKHGGWKWRHRQKNNIDKIEEQEDFIKKSKVLKLFSFFYNIDNLGFEKTLNEEDIKIPDLTINSLKGILLRNIYIYNAYKNGLIDYLTTKDLIKQCTIDPGTYKEYEVEISSKYKKMFKFRNQEKYQHENEFEQENEYKYENEYKHENEFENKHKEKGVISTFKVKLKEYNFVKCDKLIEENIKSKEKLETNIDHFAIRPYKYDISVINNDTNKIFAGKPFFINLKAIDYNGNLLKEYNISAEDYSIIAKFDNVNIENKDAGLNYFKVDKILGDFINGQVNELRTVFNEAGYFNIVAKDVNNPYAKIDRNQDTDEELYIQGKLNLLSVPYRLVVNNFDSSGYISNLKYNFGTMNNNLNTGETFNIKISALNYNNTLLKYYDSKYYQPKQLNLLINIDNIPTNVKNMYYKNNINNAQTSTTNKYISEIINNPIFNEGTFEINYYLTFGKKFNLPINEFVPKLKNIKVNIDNDNYEINLNKNLLPFRYFKLKIDNLITNKYDSVPFNAYYLYYKDNTWKVATELNNKNYIKSVRIPVNKYYSGLVEVVTNNYMVKNGKQILLNTVNAVINPFGYTIHYDIPEWLWYNPLSNNIYNFNSNNCLEHPCSTVYISNSLENNNSNNQINSTNTTNNIGIQTYKSNKGIIKFNY